MWLPTSPILQDNNTFGETETMSEKVGDGERDGGSGKEGGSSKLSLRSLLPHSSSKESVPSSLGVRSSGRLFRCVGVMISHYLSVHMNCMCIYKFKMA